MILEGSKDTKKSSGYGFSFEEKKLRRQTIFYTKRKPDYLPLHNLLQTYKFKNGEPIPKKK